MRFTGGYVVTFRSGLLPMVRSYVSSHGEQHGISVTYADAKVFHRPNLLPSSCEHR